MDIVSGWVNSRRYKLLGVMSWSGRQQGRQAIIIKRYSGSNVQVIAIRAYILYTKKTIPHISIHSISSIYD
jgi:hypothetical protein